MSAAGIAPRQSDRIDVLDVLRGIALLGMFLVHFNDKSLPGSGIAGIAIPLRTTRVAVAIHHVRSVATAATSSRSYGGIDGLEAELCSS